jgi:hypothetical protein
MRGNHFVAGCHISRRVCPRSKWISVSHGLHEPRPPIGSTTTIKLRQYWHATIHCVAHGRDKVENIGFGDSRCGGESRGFSCPAPPYTGIGEEPRTYSNLRAFLGPVTCSIEVMARCRGVEMICGDGLSFTTTSRPCMPPLTGLRKECRALIHAS